MNPWTRTTAWWHVAGAPTGPGNPGQHGPAAAKLWALGLTALGCQRTVTFLGKTRRRWATIIEAFSAEDVVIHRRLSPTLSTQRDLQGECQVLLTALLMTLVYGVQHIVCMSSILTRATRAGSKPAESHEDTGGVGKCPDTWGYVASMQ